MIVLILNEICELLAAYSLMQSSAFRKKYEIYLLKAY